MTKDTTVKEKTTETDPIFETDIFPYALSLLKGKGSKLLDGKKLAGNLYATRTGNTIAVRFHTTDILTYKDNGSVVYNNGGWQTITTKKWMNEFGPVTVYQKDFEWYVCTATGDIDFYNGLTLVKADAGWIEKTTEK